MPRIAKRATDRANRARLALNAYLLAQGLTVNSFAKECGVPQPTLWRFCSGRTKDVTPLILDALSYADIEVDDCIEERVDPCSDERIQRALNKAWDGRPETLAVLANLIEALGPAARSLSLKDGR